mgnify:CR=1 FL=1
MNILHKLKVTAVAGLVVGLVSVSGSVSAQQATPQKAPQQQGRRERAERSFDVGTRTLDVECDALEKHLRDRVGVLVCIDDVRIERGCDL